LQRFCTVLSRAWQRAARGSARVRIETSEPLSAAPLDQVKDRALLKAALSTRLSPHLRKDVGAGEGG
jgi:hypothetical protein